MDAPKPVPATKPAPGPALVKATPAPKPPKPDVPKSFGGYRGEQVISLGFNKDGKQYGPDNNPKRPGSKSAVRFALYKQGMTVKAAIDAGLESGDLVNDTHETRKFIVIK